MTQTITLQVGKEADRLAAHFWNAQAALRHWSQYCPCSAFDASAFFRTDRWEPRLVSVLPAEPMEVAADVIFPFEEVSTVEGKKETFPFIEINKRSVQRTRGEGGEGGVEEVMDKIGWFAEECDSLRGIQAIASESDFGPPVMECVADEYAKKDRIVYTCANEERCAGLMSLWRYSSNPQLPFGLMRPEGFNWSLTLYSESAIIAAAIDSLGAVNAERPSIGTIAFGMQLETEQGSLEPAIDLVSYHQPSLSEVTALVRRDNVPVYIKMDGHGYLPHRTISAYGAMGCSMLLDKVDRRGFAEQGMSMDDCNELHQYLLSLE